MTRRTLPAFAAALLAGTAISPVIAPLIIPAATAQAPADELGIAVGTQAPAITGLDQTGAPADFERLAGDNGLVIAFVRSADWCPFCKKQLKDLDSIADDLAARGFGLAALSYDNVDKLSKFAAKEKLSYTLVSDPESAVIDAFGLRNLNMAKNRRMNGIPHPAIFVIGADRTILDKLHEESYRDRPPTDLVLERVDAALARMTPKS